MLTADQKYILNLLRNSFKANSAIEEEYHDPKTIENIITRNGILQIVYQNLSAALKTHFRDQYLVAVKQSLVQDYEGERVLRTLCDAGFSCIALKGWELRRLYPDITMRQMADLDILVKPYSFSAIKTIMEKLGFTSGTENNWKHDSFKKNAVLIEMHKRLTDDSGAIRAWERGIWDRATTEDGNLFRMSPEDYYIYHFIHLHNDFMNGSLGLRRIIDTWLLQELTMDKASIQAELQRLGIWLFHERMVHLCFVTMGEEESDLDTEFLLAHAFTYGIYGSGKSYKAGRIAAMGGTIRTGKLRSGVSAVFLPYKRMKAQFPILEKWPILLPYCWGKRIVRFLSGDVKKYQHMLDYRNVNPKDFEEMKRFFEAGGVI